MSEFGKIERKWQQRWEKSRVFESDPDANKKKFFITVPYPYVNGAPHAGHAYSFLRADVYARFKRMQGFNVLFPQGFHATGEPILGVVERVRNGDKDQIEALRAQGTTDEDIKRFAKEGPEFVARYWMKKWVEILRSAGYSADWRRTFITAITPSYNKFVQWQYNTLKEKGYVVRGTHPVVWCPHDQSPTGDHDRLVGEGESSIEYVMMKFELESGEILPCGTLRPETIYGVTNLWMNPSGEYVRAEVDGKVWILGSGAAKKLKDQLHAVKILGKVSGSDVIGKSVRNPVTKREVLILPADFVQPDVATGVVMSVPSHAPFDWIGLHDLKKDPKRAEKFGVTKEKLASIAPIPIIRVEGMGESPAIEITEKMLISNQSEKEKLDAATDEVYKKEFHQGMMGKDTDYAGMKVSEAKDKVTQRALESKAAEVLWEITGEVVCRCKTKCHVKVLENQWFLKFSDENWKKVVKEEIESMKFYPEISRTQFLNTVDWLKDKACARKSGLGTKLPWDDEWIVETLSDSVIYMAYYTIAHILASKKVGAQRLTDDVFDFVFLGKGNAESVSKSSKIDKKILSDMKKQFDYFYPLNIRFSGKDLIQNHLTYFLFHHAAIFGRDKWPESVAVNGYVLLRGQKMSKRFGNVMGLNELVETYGADVARMNLVGANENMDDADWREEGVESIVSRMKFLQDVVKKIKQAKRTKRQSVDDFLLSRLQATIQNSTESYESTRFRSAIQSAFFAMYNDLKWYIDRCGGIGKCNGKVLKDFLSGALSILGPFMPHITEEMWHNLGNRKMLAESKWPVADKKLINVESEMGENMIKKTIEDAREIQRISGIIPKKIVIIVAPKWKFDIYDFVLKNKGKDFKELLSMVKEKNEAVVKHVQNLHRRSNEITREIIPRDDQLKLLKEARDFLSGQLSAEVLVEEAEKSKLEKARNADVTKPAILLI